MWGEENSEGTHVEALGEELGDRNEYLGAEILGTVLREGECALILHGSPQTSPPTSVMLVTNTLLTAHCPHLADTEIALYVPLLVFLPFRSEKLICDLL